MRYFAEVVDSHPPLSCEIAAEVMRRGINTQGDAKSRWLVLKLLEFCVCECASSFLLQVSEQSFVRALVHLLDTVRFSEDRILPAGKRAMKKMLLSLIRMLAVDFPHLGVFVATFQELVEAGECFRPHLSLY